MARDIDREEAANRIHAGAALLDAQGPGKFEHLHIPGAIRGRADETEETLATLGEDLNREIVVYCTDLNCTGSAQAGALLEAVGYRNVLRYPGGLADWADAALPVESL